MLGTEYIRPTILALVIENTSMSINFAEIDCFILLIYNLDTLLHFFFRLFT